MLPFCQPLHFPITSQASQIQQLHPLIRLPVSENLPPPPPPVSGLSGMIFLAVAQGRHPFDHIFSLSLVYWWGGCRVTECGKVPFLPLLPVKSKHQSLSDETHCIIRCNKHFLYLRHLSLIEIRTLNVNSVNSDQETVCRLGIQFLHYIWLRQRYEESTLERSLEQSQPQSFEKGCHALCFTPKCTVCSIMVCALACVWLKHLQPLVNNYCFMLCHSPESPANFLKAVGNIITLYLWISLVVHCTVNTVTLKSPLQSKICFSSLSYSWMFELHCVEYMCRFWTMSRASPWPRSLSAQLLRHVSPAPQCGVTQCFSDSCTMSISVMRGWCTSVLTALKALCFGGDGKENSIGPYFSEGPLITQKSIMDILSFVPSKVTLHHLSSCLIAKPITLRQIEWAWSSTWRHVHTCFIVFPVVGKRNVITSLFDC